MPALQGTGRVYSHIVEAADETLLPGRAVGPT
jgi:hypothetical protein